MRTARMDYLISRFLSWPLPVTVAPDLCVMNPRYPNRCGTHLLTSDEAKQMLEHVLATDEVDGLDFGDALYALKSGQRVYRAGWNGVGMWLEYHQPQASVDLPYLRLSYPVGSKLYPEGARVPWAPSQTDVLAQDWAIK